MRTRAGAGALGLGVGSRPGPVEILRDGEAQSINARIRRRYLAPEALDGPIEAALAGSDDVTLRVAPSAWRSWTVRIVDLAGAVVPGGRRLESSPWFESRRAHRFRRRADSRIWPRKISQRTGRDE